MDPTRHGSGGHVREGSAYNLPARGAAGLPGMKLALAGDTMFDRGVAERLLAVPTASLFAPEVVAAVGEADLCVLNLECCISERGAPAAGKTFHFRAPPIAVEALANLGVDCVTLANNHALDFGPDALLDTFSQLASGGIAWVGAGPEIASARAPVVLEAGGFRLGILALTDHPSDYAAAATQPGVAYANLSRGGVPDWVADAIAALDAGATLVAGHSAHLFHGIAPRVLYDLGDFLDDYRVDRQLRNDLGVLFLVDLANSRLEAIPLKLEFAHTRFADGEDAAWIRRRFDNACAAFGTAVTEEDGRLVCAWR